MTNELYAVSTADALLIDPNTDQLAIKGTALLSSTMEQTMQASELYAGRGSQLKYVHNYQKALGFSIQAQDFAPAYLAIQTGSEIKRKLSNYFKEEKVTFDSTGKATLSETPIGNVYVETASNYDTTVPTGKVITNLAFANKEFNVTYQYETIVDELTIPADSFPKAYKLVLTSDIFDADGDKAFEQQIVAERYKLDGAISFNLQHDSVATFDLNGKTLADDNGNYATMKWLDVKANKVGITMLASNPSEATLDVGESQAVITYGVRGAGYSNILMDNANLTFTSDDPAIATFVNGVITGVASGNTNVKVSDGTYTDVIDVEVI